MIWWKTKPLRLYESSRWIRLKQLNICKTVLIFIFIVSPCIARNHPPQFLINGQTEIVVRLKEDPETPVGKQMEFPIIAQLIVENK